MNGKNVERFREIYTEELTKAVIASEEKAIAGESRDYAFPVSDVPKVVERMITAMFCRNFNKDGRAIRATCRRLGIRYTYSGIENFLGVSGPFVD